MMMMKKTAILALLGGVLALGLARLAFAPLAPVTHHHANWAVFVDGERMDLSADRYMEEIAACAASDEGILPSQRIHMHENNPDIVHVHHEGATWGALMANLAAINVSIAYRTSNSSPISRTESSLTRIPFCGDTATRP